MSKKEKLDKILEILKEIIEMDTDIFSDKDVDMMYIRMRTVMAVIKEELGKSE